MLVFLFDKYIIGIIAEKKDDITAISKEFNVSNLSFIVFILKA